MNIKRGSNLLLGGCVALLVVLCWLSISAPMRFDAQRHQREQAVIGCLLQIRAAQEAYHTSHGTYALPPSSPTAAAVSLRYARR